MRNIEEIEAIKPLARIEPGGSGGDPMGEGARALLAAIKTQEAGTARVDTVSRPRRWARGRLAFGLAAAVVLAAGVVTVPVLLQDGVSSSYAVTMDDGMVTIEVRVRDFRDAAGMEQRLRELGVPAKVDYVPYGMQCRPRGQRVEDKDIPYGMFSEPENIPGEERGWQMRVNTKLFRPGQTWVWTISTFNDGRGTFTSSELLQGPVSPCEPVPAPTPSFTRSEFRSATREGRSLEGLQVDGKTVAEVLPELDKRHKKVLFTLIDVPPGNRGGYGEVRTQEEPVGGHWIVWEAEENAEGVIRLLVTEERLDRDPVEGGP
ncbi:hypothetical protein EDD27_8601 [Nonomuraea polychroma]|uniref:Uncharacterized protein n=1 Tax=Nonomuraea polychroma TaxID=46176 RepID=A0A438MIQ5_9ACTN|nr:hypothetical protein [Nonomuraea polychroma]RVX45782.1 hypothetical protein EDD27_8601 [Nonomuraea polychroma]